MNYIRLTFFLIFIHLNYSYSSIASYITKTLPCLCQNGGTCYNDSTIVIQIESYKCNCTQGFSGDRCQYDDLGCEIRKCKNDGNCAADGKCVCKIGFIGLTCEEFIGCKAGDCLTCANNGTCLQNGTCQCKFGFLGKQCESYEGCKLGGILNCTHGGLCLPNGHCNCINGFSGLTCAIGCEAGGVQACINGGICGSDLMCICKDGFTGDKCERPIGCDDRRGCLKCLNGGTCNSYGFCTCAPGFTGKICATNIGLNYSLDTAILTQNEIGSLFSMTGQIKTKLLYRASRDGFTGAAFHAKCDYKARTITLIKTKENYVFGGFTSSIWELKSNTGSYSSDSHSFLFSLRRAGTSNTICTSFASCNNKFPLRSNSATYTNYAVYSHPSNGPSFGNTDIYIPNRSDANYAQTSYNTYSASNTYLAGTNRFYASEIEVFQIECSCQNQYICSNVYPPFDSCVSLFDSIILSLSENSYLVSITQPTRTSTLLYRATRDGFAASSFHSRCDGRANTVTIIKTNSNYVFGVYTSAKWSSSSGWVSDSTAFIFSLRKSGGSSMEKFPIITSVYSIYGYSSYGPTFGGGHDVYIADNSNMYSGSYTNFGHSYSLPAGYAYGQSNTKSYLAGSYYGWLTIEIEVFQL